MAAACPRAVLEPMVQLIAPLAPHLGEELWARLGHEGGISYVPWPSYDAALIAEATITWAVQVNGKKRGDVELPAETDQATALAAARAVPNVARFLEGVQVVKEIVVPGRMVSFVVR